MSSRFTFKNVLICSLILQCSVLFLHPSFTPQADAAVKNTSVSTEDVVPTLYCLGSCPTTVPSVTTTTSVTPLSTTTQPGTSPEPTVDPCSAGQSSIQDHRHKKHRKHHRGNGGGFLSKLFEFIMKFIELILKQFGGTFPSNPNPIDPSPSLSPEDPLPTSSEPVPCPSDAPSTAPTDAAPTTGTAPTTTQATTAPTTAQNQQCATSVGQKEVTIDGKKAPNPLTLKNGNAVTCVPVWESQRRAEILADFRQSVYGTQLTATKQSFSVQSADVGNVKRKIVTVSITGPTGSGTFPFKLFIPKASKPKGTFVMLNHRGASSNDPAQSGEYLPVAKITAAGYAIAVIDAGDTAPDDSGSYASKALKWFYGSSVPENGSRAVGVWAWSASRAMDYLATDPDIDATKVAVIGHSRSGKASLWAGAQDTRFAAVISNDSGNSGAKFARRSNTGETVAAINSQFPHWFPQTYKAFSGKEASLPVDQHELLALVAPRRVIVASATNDATSDPQGEFISYMAAAEVYKLYGLGNTGLSGWQPATNKDFRGDAMSYHLRSGDHGLTNVDWDMYLNGNIFTK